MAESSLPFDAERILGGLTGFQRDAVENAVAQLYDTADASHRYLIADETGLGKSVIARGIVARTIERLLTSDSVDRIDIVYVCSNPDLAQQNIRRLDVTGHPQIAISTRLTLLALQSAKLKDAPRVG